MLCNDSAAAPRYSRDGNPLTYEIDALRALMLANGTSTFGLGWDCGILLSATAILVVLGARLYPRVVT